MKPFMKTAMAAGVAGALTLAAASPSLARNNWAAVGAGFAAGTFVGAAAANANARYYYDEPYGYAVPGPVYYETVPAYETYGYSYPSRSYYGRTNGPHREDTLTGSGIGAVR